MADPIMLVARGAGIGKQADADIEVSWNGLTPERFLELLAPLHFSVAGVPVVLERFRSGDESLIACDPLSVADDEPAAVKLAAQINRNVFFDSLTETTRLLQAASLSALAATSVDRAEIRDRVSRVWRQVRRLPFPPLPDFH